MTMRRLWSALAVLALLTGTVAVGLWFVRNPETATLDAAARARAPGRFVTLSDGVTHYDITGPDSGRTVVLVHGFSVPYYIWDSTAAGLGAAGYRVIRYDVFGRGLSDRPDTRYDGALYDRQLAELLDSLGVTGQVDLMGLSHGGYITAHFIASHASRVRSWTLVDPIATRSTLPAIMTMPGVGAYLWQVLQAPKAAAGQPSDFLHPERWPDWVARYEPQMRYKGFGRALRRSAINASTVDFAALYKAAGATGVPVLLLWGKQDRTIDIAQAKVVTDNIPAAVFVPVDSAGHLPHMEQAALVRARMLEFLAAHQSRP